MGKYMGRNSKTTGEEVSLLDIPPHGGVRTRAKTLALQKAAVSSGTSSYIQLRSRRLVKPNPPKRQKENRVPPKPNKNSSRGAGSSRMKVSSGKSSGSVKDLPDRKEEVRQESEVRVAEDLGIDEKTSFGENMVEIEGRERSTRESTPCNLIRDPDTITTPTSSTKKGYSSNANYRFHNSAPRPIPTTVEMEDLFTEPEKQQQKLFIEKYNFDPVNEKPLSGRYEWVKVDDTKNVD